jgi:vacuolar protein sorting-associated protein 13D
MLIKNWCILPQTFDRKTWDVVCDLSAPQIIIPEHFVDKEALIMVVDFGKLHVTNGHLVDESKKNNSSSSAQMQDEDDEDEEFCTPASSPGSPAEDFKSPRLSRVTSAQEQAEITEAALVHKMYDRYKIVMNGMQVILGKVIAAAIQIRHVQQLIINKVLNDLI